jgi:hypothetical protein
MTLVISKGLTLDNGTRAAAIAGVSPTLDYRFAREKREIETVSLTDKLTYTGGNGTFVGSDGFIQRATTNVPRFDHDPLSRQSLGLLSEGSSENLLLRSEEFNIQPPWNTVRASIAANAAMGPDGNITADKLIANTDNNTHFIRQQSVPALAATTYTFSVYAKQAGLTGIRLVEGQEGTLLAAFDLTNGTGTAGSIVNAGNGWYRCSDQISVAGTLMAPQMRLLSGSTQSFAGNNADGIFVWGAQVEQAAAPSTYIPTSASTVTRTVDSAVIDGTGVITGTYTMVEKPAGCAVVSGTNINLEPGFTAERVMVFPAALDAGQITAIRGAM